MAAGVDISVATPFACGLDAVALFSKCQNLFISQSTQHRGQHTLARAFLQFVHAFGVTESGTFRLLV